MKQGTISVLFGCHSIVHSWLVIRSWKILYSKWPKPWQIICILLHDIGHWGKNYLSSAEEKRRHWVLGAMVARKLFGRKGFYLCIGHTMLSTPDITMHKPDKYSYYIAPTWWLWTNCIFEPKLRMGYSIKEAVKRFRKQVANSIESGAYTDTHEHYLNRCMDTQ